MYVCMYTHTRMYIYIHACSHAYICIHTHTLTLTHTLTIILAVAFACLERVRAQLLELLEEQRCACGKLRRRAHLVISVVI